ncbi:MAG: rhomboid family intramembrane serine protease [Cytophagaceae bacterium]
MSGILDELKYNLQKQDNGLFKIIVINVAIYLVLVFFWIVVRISQNEAMAEAFAWVYLQFHLPSDFFEFIRKPWTIFTYFFGHNVFNHKTQFIDIFHILFNMIFLYWFGKLIMEYIGNRRFINIYILGGLIGGLIYLLAFNSIPYFINNPSLLIGSSGSVYAIAVAAATLLPQHRFHLLLLGPVRIIYIVAFYIFISIIGTIESNAGGNICHLGGALLGFTYIRLLHRGYDMGKPINVISGWFRNIGKPRMKVYSNKNIDLSTPSQAEIDSILDKINRSGYKSLSKEEKEKLLRVSKK